MERGKLSNILNKIPLFRGLSETEISLILDMPKSYQSFSNQEVIIAEGDRDDAFFILLQGKVDIWRKNRLIASVEPPQFIGELGFVLGEPRIATAVAASDKVVTMRITAFHFKSLPGHIRECVKDRIIEGLSLRLQNTSDAIRESDVCPEFKSKLMDTVTGGDTF